MDIQKHVLKFVHENTAQLLLTTPVGAVKVGLVPGQQGALGPSASGVTPLKNSLLWRGAFWRQDSCRHQNTTSDASNKNGAGKEAERKNILTSLIFKEPYTKAYQCLEHGKY